MKTGPPSCEPTFRCWATSIPSVCNVTERVERNYSSSSRSMWRAISDGGHRLMIGTLSFGDEPALYGVEAQHGNDSEDRSSREEREGRAPSDPVDQQRDEPD